MEDVYVIMDCDEGRCCGVYSDYLTAAKDLIDFLIRQDFFESEDFEEMRDDLLYGNSDLSAEWYGFTIDNLTPNKFAANYMW